MTKKEWADRLRKVLDAFDRNGMQTDIVECHFPRESFEEIIGYLDEEPVKVEIRRKYAKFLPDQINHGAWYQISPAKIYECSQCGQNVMTNDIETYKYCHGCGAFMDMKGDEE